MTARRSLNLKLALSIVLAFAVSMAVTWFVHDRLAAREADRLIDSAFSDVEMDIRSRVNARLVRQAMAVRERLEDGAKTDVLSLRVSASLDLRTPPAPPLRPPHAGASDDHWHSPRHPPSLRPLGASPPPPPPPQRRLPLHPPRPVPHS